MKTYFIKKFRLSFILIIASSAIMIFNSCCTILWGTKEKVTFNSDPPGAEIFVSDMPTGKITPATITVIKKKAYLGYIIKKENYLPVKINDHYGDHDPNAMFISFGNFPFAILPGILVDMIYHSSIDLTNSFNVTLQYTPEYLALLAEIERKKQAETDSIEKINLNKRLEPGRNNPYKIISPKYEFLYLGSNGKNHLAEGIGDAISSDGRYEVHKGEFLKGKLVSGVIIDKQTNITYSGKYIDEDLISGLIEGDFGEFAGNFMTGKLYGTGTFRKGDTYYNGEFVNGKFEGSGVIKNNTGEKFEGSFKNGQPHGSGIYINGDQIERCEYYYGKRIDQAYLIKQENLRAEAIREKERLQNQAAYEKYMAEQQEKLDQQKSSNNLLKVLLAGAVAYTVYKSVDASSMVNNLDKISSAAGGSGKSATSTSSNCDLSNYRGPTYDIQSDSFCQWAYMYKCQGNLEAVKESCKRYEIFRQTNPGLPTCPYCK